MSTFLTYIKCVDQQILSLSTSELFGRACTATTIHTSTLSYNLEVAVDRLKAAYNLELHLLCPMWKAASLNRERAMAR